MVYIPGKEVYEIKPLNDRQIAKGMAQLAGYVALFNQLDPTPKRWDYGSRLTYTPPPTLFLPDVFAEVFVGPPVAGIITYTYCSVQDYVSRQAKNTAATEAAESDEDLATATLNSILGGV